MATVDASDYELGCRIRSEVQKLVPLEQRRFLSVVSDFVVDDPNLQQSIAVLASQPRFQLFLSGSATSNRSYYLRGLLADLEDLLTPSTITRLSIFLSGLLGEEMNTFTSSDTPIQHELHLGNIQEIVSSPLSNASFPKSSQNNTLILSAVILSGFALLSMIIISALLILRPSQVPNARAGSETSDQAPDTEDKPVSPEAPLAHQTQPKPMESPDNTSNPIPQPTTISSSSSQPSQTAPVPPTPRIQDIDSEASSPQRISFSTGSYCGQTPAFSGTRTFILDVAKGQTLGLSLVRGGAADMEIISTGPMGTIRPKTVTDREIRYTIPASGDYFIKMIGADSGTVAELCAF